MLAFHFKIVITFLIYILTNVSLVSEVDVCGLPVVVGPCEAAIPSWAFDARSGQCQSFTFGGCQGNGNRFSTLEACEARCVDSVSMCMDRKGQMVKSGELYRYSLIL